MQTAYPVGVLLLLCSALLRSAPLCSTLHRLQGVHHGDLWLGLEPPSSHGLSLIPLLPHSRLLKRQVSTVTAYGWGWATIWNVNDLATYVIQVGKGGEGVGGGGGGKGADLATHIQAGGREVGLPRRHKRLEADMRPTAPQTMPNGMAWHSEWQPAPRCACACTCCRWRWWCSTWAACPYPPIGCPSWLQYSASCCFLGACRAQVCKAHPDAVQPRCRLKFSHRPPPPLPRPAGCSTSLASSAPPASPSWTR